MNLVSRGFGKRSGMLASFGFGIHPIRGIAILLSAAILKTQAKSLSFSAAIQNAGIQQIIALSAALRKTSWDDVELDAAIQATGLFDLVSLDGALWDQFAKLVNLDAGIFRAAAAMVYLDAVIQPSSGPQDGYLFTDLDGAIAEIKTKLMDLSAVLVNENTKSVGMDSAIQKFKNRFALLDAVVIQKDSLALSVDGVIAILPTLNISFDARIDAGTWVLLDALISTDVPFSGQIDLDALISTGHRILLDASIVGPTQDDDLDRHRFKGDKDEGGEYGTTTQTEATYPRGLNPGE